MKLKLTLFIIICSLFYNADAKLKPSILVIYNTPKKIPNKNWKDGFVAAMTLLEDKYNISWCTLKNFNEYNYNDFDVIFVKSSWNTPCDKFVRKHIPKHKRKALLISNTNLPSRENYGYYDVLFYETNWYKKFIKKHPNAIHAFGINTNIMKPPTKRVDKIYDYIMVCDFKYSSKRHLKLLTKPGTKLAIGSIDSSKNNPLVKKLENAGVKVINFVEPEELAKLYHQSHKCYLPCKINGGGDRSVLEARSCGVEVEIESDNPKLRELLQSPIYDHYYYAQQLEKGIQILLNKK